MLAEWRLEAGRPVRPCGSQEPGGGSQAGGARQGEGSRKASEAVWEPGARRGEPGGRSLWSHNDHLPWDFLEVRDLNHPWTLARCQENAQGFASSVPEVPPRILPRKTGFYKL